MLIAQLDQAISELEATRDAMASPPDALFDRIDELYQQRGKLLQQAIEAQTVEYQAVVAGLNAASALARQAREDVSRVDKLLARLGSVLSGLTGLLG